MSRCEITDLPIEYCAHCLGHKSVEEEEQEDDLAFISNIAKWGY